ncbi:MAG TPA: hypothetical protein VGR96_16855 [Acidobacteriaceae bacterium]|nr:hypothetical protein [Acidobacteriaceae bacterium]
MDKVCKHPKVRIVAREEDVEYVECQDCGEVFDSNEFRDMAIEENVGQEPEEIDARPSGGARPLRGKRPKVS